MRIAPPVVPLLLAMQAAGIVLLGIVAQHASRGAQGTAQAISTFELLVMPLIVVLGLTVRNRRGRRMWWCAVLTVPLLACYLVVGMLLFGRC
jgi:hypothetical protein